MPHYIDATVTYLQEPTKSPIKTNGSKPLVVIHKCMTAGMKQLSTAIISSYNNSLPCPSTRWQCN